MRWMLDHTEGNLITVNLPEFVLHVYEGKNKKFDMKVVVGKEGHNTTIFTGNLNQIVFSPYWNVPYDIVEKEILPAIEKNPNYLAENEMEEVGEPVGGADADVESNEENHLPVENGHLQTRPYTRFGFGG